MCKLVLFRPIPTPPFETLAHPLSNNAVFTVIWNGVHSTRNDNSPHRRGTVTHARDEIVITLPCDVTAGLDATVPACVTVSRSSEMMCRES